MPLVTLREAAEILDKSYDTIRRYSKRYDTFPKPVMTSRAGNGIAWQLTDIEAWWKDHDENMPDRSTRAKIGHQNRLTRQMEGYW